MIKQIRDIADPGNYEFHQTSFSNLMQIRIQNVLLICSNYDAFMLEEDGRIDEQIFNEYVSLNLSTPPRFLKASGGTDAFGILEEEKIDLIISMFSIGGESDIFNLAKQIKSEHPGIPIVVLTYFSREVSMKLANEDLSAIDYVFCWLGNADLLLAIIKLIEDKMNAENDVETGGVQTILLVENSIRYTSSYLPNLYKIILKQSRDFAREALNAHQKNLRMRGRPKILLATNYEEAIDIYKRYKNNLLGVISDISYSRKGRRDPQAGIRLCRKVKSDDPHMPVLLQSSDMENHVQAEELKAGFIHKYSKTLSIELRNFVIRQFSFGEFIFRDPDTKEEVCRAADLQAMQQAILTIPEKVLYFHSSNNHFSKWLNARALFPIARMFKHLKVDDFDSIEEVRRYIHTAISSFRSSKGRGVIAKFDKNSFDEYLMFSRIGEGSIGGKARGLAFINSILNEHGLFTKFPGAIVTIPRTVVLSTDIFDEFMETNDLYRFAISGVSDEEILQRFVDASLPGRLHQDLYAFISVVRNPVAIRSSSKLEDSHYQPFAGIYSTYMIPRVEDSTRMIGMLTDAIKSVYASVYYKSSRAYMTATANVIDEEKMGIILQEVCGTRNGDRFYPTISGVARSINFYPIAPEKPEDGIASIAYGLGKLIVDGGISLRFSPKYPKKILQLSSPDQALRETQKKFYSLDLNVDSFRPSTDDSVNILKLGIKDAENDPSFRFAASTYDYEYNMLREGMGQQGRKVVTFANVLTHSTFPLAEILQELLDSGQHEMNNPIEIEFAVDLDTPKDEPGIFYFLQIRPIVHGEQKVDVNFDRIDKNNTIVYSESALGYGTITNISDFVYVKPDKFNPSENKDIALEIEKINENFIKEGRNYVLTGPGRWGSSDPWLGIPIKWPQISMARVIIESGLDNYHIDPSQGTHFFQNLTSFRVGYFTINPHFREGLYDVDFLDGQPAYYEDTHVRHVRFEQPFKIQIDGRHNKGVIFKPQPVKEGARDMTGIITGKGD
ncbi:MAG: phosphoenolpyruvate synthase [Marinilabiliales bacterium]|nr:MAG: phosphoenolpyruvate synthase [Marinilabiliales bacterium]